jgi:3-oxoacyl-[acyl-carrier-protein] synthase III
MKQYGVKLRGIGVDLPSTAIRNDDLSQLVETSDEWINSRTGFKNRRVVSGDERVIDLAIQSSKDALQYAGLDASDLGLIILACSTPDEIYPAGSGRIQHALGAHKAFGFDVSMACSGLIHAMNIAIQFIENGTVEHALIVASDVHSRYTNWADRNTCVLFGDASGAFVLSRSTPEETDILGIDFLLDGSRGSDISLPINRLNCPLVQPKSPVENTNVQLNGREVFRFAVTDVPQHIKGALEKSNLSSSDIDFFVLHQANERIMTSLSERMDIDPEKIALSVKNYSNTSAATIPLAMYDYIESGKIQQGHKLLLCGFGAGMAIATALLRWDALDHRTPQQKQAIFERLQPVFLTPEPVIAS